LPDRECARGDKSVPDEQNNDRSDGGTDEARALVRTIPTDRLTDPRHDKRPGDSELRGEDNGEGLS